MERVAHKVGEIFEYNNVKLQVFEHTRGDIFKCSSCYFITKRHPGCDKQRCSPSDRHDRKSVFFELIH